MPGIVDEDGISLITETGALKLEFNRDWHGNWSAHVVGEDPVPIPFEAIKCVSEKDTTYVSFNYYNACGHTVTLPFDPYGLDRTVRVSLADDDFTELGRLLSIYHTRYASTS